MSTQDWEFVMRLGLFVQLIALLPALVGATFELTGMSRQANWAFFVMLVVFVAGCIFVGLGMCFSIAFPITNTLPC